MAEETSTSTEQPEGSQGAEGQGQETEGQEEWKSHARKHERRAKQEKERADDLQAKLDKAAESNKSETEKALDKARKEARAEAETEFQKQRKADRLDVAVTRLAAKSFADTEDALVNVERAIAGGDIDEGSIFDGEGKVQTDALKRALDDLLERKPHLKAGGSGRPEGDIDAGRGEAGSGHTFNDDIRAKARGR